MSIQKEMKEKLELVGIPFHEIQVYGRQITVECISFETCINWKLFIKKFAKVKGILKSSIYTKNNKRSEMNPSVMTVFRLYATIS